MQIWWMFGCFEKTVRIDRRQDVTLTLATYKKWEVLQLKKKSENKTKTKRKRFSMDKHNIEDEKITITKQSPLMKSGRENINIIGAFPIENYSIFNGIPNIAS